MICPACGTTMNHHADKLGYGEGVTAESSWGGVVMKVHTCPACGDVETQRDPEDPITL
jgi:ribosomal protein S27AE